MLFVSRLWWLHGSLLRRQLHLLYLAIIRKIIQDLRAMFRLVLASGSSETSPELYRLHHAPARPLPTAGYYVHQQNLTLRATQR